MRVVGGATLVACLKVALRCGDFMNFPVVMPVVCTALLLQATSSLGAELQAHQLYAKEVYKQLVEINTTRSVGDTTLAAQAMADRLIAAGLPAADVHVLAEVPRNGNLIARLRAKKPGSKRPILLLAHLDVVEAKRDDWSMDPFKFIEQDGYYYGRGSLDDKAMASMFVANLIRYLQEGYRPDRDIILALTADEEKGDYNGVTWLVANHRQLIDAAFALNEGGSGQMRAGKKILNGVQAAEKVFQSFTLTATNRGGHSSQPRKDNAIYDLSQALVRVAQFEFPVTLNDVTRTYFARMSTLETGQAAADFKAISLPNPPADTVQRLSDHPAYNSTLRTTCVATQLEGGHAENALPQTAKAVVNCRILPGHDPAAVLQTLQRVVASGQVSVEPVEPAVLSPPSPLTPEVFKPIEKLTQKMWPGIPVVPLMSTGATDAIFLRSKGIPVYGVSGIFSDIDDVRTHGRDERIAIQSYFDGLEFLYQLVKELTH
jgi:acetylornithine deacetylase/succinyl-diaminopimelate desuccinylase-like protein